MLQYLLCIITGYFFGCIMTAEIISFYKSKQSIRSMGSGNPGMTNTIDVYGLKYGVIVLLGDIFKTGIACVVSVLLFSLPDSLAILYTGFGVIIGHNFPFWNGFHGGKGVACTCTTLFLFSPGWGLLSCIAGFLLCLFTKHLAIGAIVIPGIFCIIAFFLYHQFKIWGICVLILLLMIQRHFPSLKRIVKGKEKPRLWWNRKK